MFQYTCLKCGARIEFYATMKQIRDGLKIHCSICGSSHVRIHQSENMRQESQVPRCRCGMPRRA